MEQLPLVALNPPPGGLPLCIRTGYMQDRVPSDTCYLAPDSFNLELSKIHLITHQVFISPHCTILFPEVSTAYDSSAHEQHPQRDITLQQSWRLYWKMKDHPARSVSFGYSRNNANQ